MDKEKTISELCQDVRQLLMELRDDWLQLQKEKDEKKEFSEEIYKQEELVKTDNIGKQLTSFPVDLIAGSRRKNRKRKNFTSKRHKNDIQPNQGGKNMNLNTDDYNSKKNRNQKHDNYTSQRRESWKEGGQQNDIIKIPKRRKKRREYGWVTSHKVKFKEKGRGINISGWINKDYG